MNVPCMFTLCEVDEVRQVPVLPEELRERDPLAGRGRVDLVRRREDDDDVAGPVRMQRVVPSTLRSSSFFTALRNLCRLGRVGSVRFGNAAMIRVRTPS